LATAACNASSFIARLLNRTDPCGKSGTTINVRFGKRCKTAKYRRTRSVAGNLPNASQSAAQGVLWLRYQYLHYFVLGKAI
jgi:hypothetical protein